MNGSSGGTRSNLPKRRGVCRERARTRATASRRGARSLASVARIADRRRDLTHKRGTRIFRENPGVCAERWSVKELLANPKLTKSIADVGRANGCGNGSTRRDGAATRSFRSTVSTPVGPDATPRVLSWSICRMPRRPGPGRKHRTESSVYRTPGMARRPGSVFLCSRRPPQSETSGRTPAKQEVSVSAHWESPGFPRGRSSMALPHRVAVPPC
jgi:hypothetical protein